MIILKTAEEMYKYCVDNKLGRGLSTSKKLAIKHFRLLIENLMPEEEIYCVFIGSHNYINITMNCGDYAYAITNKRCIMAQHKIFDTDVQAVNNEDINDITKFKLGRGLIGMGTICIDTDKGTINVGVNTPYLDNIYGHIHEIWDTVRQNKEQGQDGSQSPINDKSNFELLKELKELLDMGIVTQEEFDLKKKELLGL